MSIRFDEISDATAAYKWMIDNPLSVITNDKGDQFRWNPEKYMFEHGPHSGEPWWPVILPHHLPWKANQ
jgi:hypothetical protein